MTVNGYDNVTPLMGGADGTGPVPRSRREERRADEMARAERRRADELARREAARLDRAALAEERRADRDAELERERIRRADAAKEKSRKAKEKAARRKERRQAFVAGVTEHMPLAGIPVVAVSLLVGWTGQAQAAVHLGMGALAFGMPVLTEGMVLTLAGLTAHALGAKPEPKPYAFLYRATWAAGLFAALSNAGGHLIEDSSPEGVYRASAYALASLAGLVLWAIVMRSKKANADGTSAAEASRWRRIRRAHPIVARRAQRIADLSGRDYPEAFAIAWERRTAAGTAEPTVKEIRAQRRAAFERAQAQAWDGRSRRSGKATQSVPGTAADTAEVVVDESPVVVPETGSGLWLPTGPDGAFERRDAVPATAPEGGAENSAEGPGALFPPGIGASGTGSDDGAKKTSRKADSRFDGRLLKRAAAEWKKIHGQAQQDPAYRSPKGHLGVSPYALAQRLHVRKADGPALVQALIDRQMIPVGE